MTLTAYHGLAAMVIIGLAVNIFFPPRFPTTAEVRRDFAAAWPQFISERYGTDLDRAARDFDVPRETVDRWLAGATPSGEAVAVALVMNWGLEGKMVRLWRASATQERVE